MSKHGWNSFFCNSIRNTFVEMMSDTRRMISHGYQKLAEHVKKVEESGYLAGSMTNGGRQCTLVPETVCSCGGETARGGSGGKHTKKDDDDSENEKKIAALYCCIVVQGRREEEEQDATNEGTTIDVVDDDDNNNPEKQDSA
eukprot:CAMPEP_0170849512 /NCGR_PEP_ID=MMETSP0734-20130129/10052_1 /TAXON_ID=186038 /ORGANISM="Fragilariopsis kerguelensis, Strain L26-C5" /LENGTH=141 /DNA_ID=CAMNT_0011219195 /DNA_START=677 /DNA_END=1100 /DNA_ORIENTATION=+